MGDFNLMSSLDGESARDTYKCVGCGSLLRQPCLNAFVLMVGIYQYL